MIHYLGNLDPLYFVSLQFLLGVFYYIEAATLLEDFEPQLNHTKIMGEGYIRDIEYFHSDDVTHAYKTAA